MNDELIDYSIPKPDKKDYDTWEAWFDALCKYIVLKYKKTY
jgi:hypothetical protein